MEVSNDPELSSALAIFVVLTLLRGRGIAPLTPKRPPYGVIYDLTQAEPSSLLKKPILS
jgi:hypothetical protein